MSATTAHVRRREIHMNEGSIVGCLVRFALPLFLGNLFQQLYNMVDTWVIGQYGATGEYAAVGSVGPIVNIFIGFFSGLASGAGVIISQYFGAGNEEGVHDTVHTALSMTAIMALIFTALGVTGTPWMLSLMMDSAESASVFPYAKTYLYIYFAGITSLLVYNMGAGILRAVGDSQRPFYYLVVSAVTNIVLDLVFVAVFKWGVMGVAVATVIAQTLSAALTVRALLLPSAGAVRVYLHDLKMKGALVKKILWVGFPAALQMAITAFSNVFVQSYIGGVTLDGIPAGPRSEEISLAGWTTYSKLDQFIFLPIQSLGLAATTFVGQNLGSDQPERARRGTWVAWGLAIGVTLFLMMPLIIFADKIPMFFTGDADVVKVSAILLRQNTFFYIFCCFNQVFACALRGAGNTRAPMIIMLLSFVGFRQLYLWIMTSYISNDLRPVTFGYPLGWMLCATIMVTYFFIVGLKGPKLTEEK